MKYFTEFNANESLYDTNKVQGKEAKAIKKEESKYLKKLWKSFTTSTPYKMKFAHVANVMLPLAGKTFFVYNDNLKFQTSIELQSDTLDGPYRDDIASFWFTLYDDFKKASKYVDNKQEMINVIFQTFFVVINNNKTIQLIGDALTGTPNVEIDYSIGIPNNFSKEDMNEFDVESMANQYGMKLNSKLTKYLNNFHFTIK